MEAAMMFNDHSVYGRNHDIFRDYRDYDGRDLLVISTEPVDDGDFAEQSAVFEEAREIAVSGSQGSYRALYGQAFDYQKYRANHLGKTLSKLYDQIPPLYAACYMDRFC